jgi:hypothetical protein
VPGYAAHAVSPHLRAERDVYEIALAPYGHPTAPEAFIAFEGSRWTGAVMTPERCTTRVTRDLMLPTATKQGVHKNTEACFHRPSPWPVRVD